MKRIWPETLAEFEALERHALAKYLPLTMKLQVWELTALNKALGQALDALKAEAGAEDVRRGFRPPGTKFGNR